MLISCGTLKKQNGGYEDISKANFDNIAFVFFSEKHESYSEGNQGRNSVGTNQSEVNKSHFQRKISSPYYFIQKEAPGQNLTYLKKS